MNDRSLVLLQRLILGLLIVLVATGLLVGAGVFEGRLEGDSGEMLSQVAEWVAAEVAVPYWAFVFLLLTGIPFWLGLLKSVRRAAVEGAAGKGDDALQYREDHFQGVIWQWNYDPVEGTSLVRDLICCCPSCRKPLVWRENTFTPLGPVALVACEGCGFSKGLEGKRKVVIDMVQRNIRHQHQTGGWQSRLRKPEPTVGGEGEKGAS